MQKTLISKLTKATSPAVNEDISGNRTYISTLNGYLSDISWCALGYKMKSYADMSSLFTAYTSYSWNKQ